MYGDVTKKVIITTAGRVRFNEIWPRELGYINRNVGKKQMGDIIWRCYQTVGKERTVQTLDALKTWASRKQPVPAAPSASWTWWFPPRKDGN